jgi:hypothetical protein
VVISANKEKSHLYYFGACDLDGTQCMHAKLMTRVYMDSTSLLVACLIETTVTGYSDLIADEGGHIGALANGLIVPLHSLTGKG